MSVQTPRFRPILEQFAPYKPGKPPAVEGGPTYKLSSNESPFGPLPSVVKVIAAAAGEVNRYPDNGAAELTEAIAARYAVPVSHVAVGCGSVGLVQQLLEAVADPGARCSRGVRSRRTPTWRSVARLGQVPLATSVLSTRWRPPSPGRR
jgi:histidinol-phosphate aminotransferase